MSRLVLVILLFINVQSVFGINYYWIGGSGNWSDPNHWSLSSGGASAAVVPTATDNAIFDNNSGLVSVANTVNLNAALTITDLDFSAVSTAFTISSSLASIEVRGNLKSNSLATIAWSGDINLNPSVTGKVILSSGRAWSNNFRIIGTQVVALSDHLSTTADIYVESGGLNSSSKNISCNNFYSTSTSSRNINLSNSRININGTQWSVNSTSLTFSATSSGIHLNNAAAFSFAGGNQVYDSIISNSASINVSNNNTFNFLSVAASSSLIFDNGSSQKIDSLNTIGTCTSKTIIRTVNNALTAATLEKSGSSLIFYGNALSINNVNTILTGGKSYKVSLSDTTKALNWTFNGTNYYWIGNGGNWDDPNHWSFTSGGSVAGCIPSSEDHAIFDSQSFSSNGQIVTVNVNSNIGSMDWSLSTETLTFKLQANLFVRGNVTFQPNLTVNRNLALYRIEFNRQATLTSSGAYVDCNIAVNTLDDTQFVVQSGALNMNDSSGIYIIRGGYNSGSGSIATGIIKVIQVSTADHKELILGSSSINLKSGFDSENVSSNFTFNAGTSSIYIGALNKLNRLTTEGLTFYDVTLDFHTSNSAQRLGGNNTYHKLKILKGSEVEIDSTSIHTVTDSLIMLGNCNERIVLTSSNLPQVASFNKSNASTTKIECVDFTSISNTGATLTAFYSNNISGNVNWNFSTTNAVTSNFTVQGPYCFGDTTLFINLSTAVSGNTNDITSYWYFDDGSTGYWNHTSPTDSNWVSYELDTNKHVFISGGDFDVMLVTEYTNFCKDTLISTVHINKPTVFLYSSDLNKTICEEETVTFEASSYTNLVQFEFFWNGTSQNTPSANDTLLVTNSLQNQDTIAVLAYENGCVSDTMPQYVFTVHDAPVFSWSSNDADNTICSNSPITFTTSAVDPSYTFQFQVNGVPATSFIQPGTFTSSTLTDQNIVSVIAKNSQSCKDTLSSTITVLALPSTTLSSSASGNVICSGDAITFTGSGASNYEFFVGGVSQGISASNTFTTSALTSGVQVSVKGYSASGCSKLAPETFSYTVNALPTVSMTISDADTSICSGQNVVFNASGAALYQLFRNGIGQGAPAPSNSFTISNLVNNEQIYIVGSFSGCSNQSTTATFEVFQSPTTTLSSSDANNIICAEDDIIFTASGANSYQFFVNGVSQGPASTNPIFAPSSISNGSTVLVSGISNGCVLNQSLTITVLPIPSVSLFSSDIDNTICNGQSITFTGANASQYEFFVNNVSQGAASSTSTYTPSLAVGSNSIYVIGTGSNGCKDTSSTTLNVTVNPIPVVTLTSSDANNSICEGESINFIASGANFYQFFLDGISQGSMSVTNTYTNPDFNNGQIISVTGSSLGCTSSASPITITISPVPAINLTSTDVDNVFCEGSTVQFNASGATLYSFEVNDVVVSPLSTQNQINSAGFTAGTYDVLVTGENNGCQASDSLEVTVNYLPTATLISSDPDNTICTGNTIGFTAGGGSLYQFLVNGVTQGAISPVNTFTTSSLTNGANIGVNVISSMGCTDQEQIGPFTVNPSPTVNITGSDADLSICTGQNITFITSGGGSYEYFINGISQGTASGVNSLSSSALSDGDVITCNVVLNSCSSTSSPLIIEVNNYPTVSLSNNEDQILCTGELTDLVANGALNYQFFVNGVPNGTLSSNPNLNVAVTNGAVVTVSGEMNGCSSLSSNSITYTVQAYPTISGGVFPGTTACYDDQVVVNASGAQSYNFSVNGTLQQTGSSNNFQPDFLQTGDQIQIVGFNGDCASNPVQYIMTINTMDLVLTANPSNLICEGETVQFTASGANQYQFYLNGSPVGAMSGINTYSSSTLNDLDEISVIGHSNTSGCNQSLASAVQLNIITEPIITAQSALQFCEGDSVVLMSNASYGNQWLLDGTPISGATDTFYVAHTSGNYSLDVVAGGNGDLWSFGQNNFGIMATGDQVNHADPIQANTNIQFQQISTGDNFAMALALNGDLYTWGDNEFGQLGDGTFSDKLVPLLNSQVNDVKVLATTEASSVALTNSGQVYVWGANSNGQLGTGSTSVINFPFANNAISQIDTIAGGRKHFVYLKTDGTVWTVGNNSYGQLGTGNLNNSSLITQVSALSNIVAVGAGDYHSFAIGSNGELYVWGNNTTGQLGLGDLTNRLVPTLSSLRDIVQANGGAEHSLILDENKRVFATGGNAFGQLGTGNLLSTNLPQNVGTADGTVQISAGTYTSLVRLHDNRVLGFGRNSQFELSSYNGNTIVNPEWISDLDGSTFIEASKNSSHVIFGDNATCSSSGINVNVLSSPEVTISSNIDTFTTISGVSYQWYLNGNLIPGATSQSYEAQTSGYYSVSVTLANGCVGTSEQVYHSMASLESLSHSKLKVYPNPASTEINIEFANSHSISEIVIMDEFGKEIKRISSKIAGPINIENLARGVYFVQIQSEGNLSRTRFVKN